MLAWRLPVVVLDRSCHEARTDFHSSCVRSVDRASDYSLTPLALSLLLQVGGSNELIAGKRRVVTNEMAMSADYHQVRSSLADKDRPEAVES